MSYPNHPPTVTFQGVTLVAQAPEHDANTVAWLNDRRIRATFGISRSVLLQGHRRWMREQTDLLSWAIVHQEMHVGNCSARENVRHRSAYLQIYLGSRASEGRGIGTKAASAMLDFLFGMRSTHRVWLHVFPENDRAVALYHGLGFRSEGLERDAVYADGAFRSHMRMSLLAPEWTPVGAAW